MDPHDDVQRPVYPAAQPVTERVIVTAAPPPRRGLLSYVLRFFLFLFMALPVLFVLGAIAAGVHALSGDQQIVEHYHSLSHTATDKIAIITVEGAILDGDGFVKRQIDKVRDDSHVRAVVLRIDSPGGTVTASDYLYHHLRELAKDRDIPIVVSMGGMAASGGYYIAMAVGSNERAIFAEPTTWTGSIGVIIPHYNIAGLMKTWDIEEDSVKSGPLKQMGSPTKPLTPEERAIFQHLVDDSFHRFQAIVKAGRPALAKDPEALAKVSTGQVFTTDEAISNGLVDEEGFIERAIDRAIELAHRSRDAVKVVKYRNPASLFSMPFSARAAATPDLARLVELASPRAYYLHTWLPPLGAPF
ncbi:MAG: signal peptide peptidase SppA [Planctomycetia bacterium]|nr:signal peptide peptidase SppA [Planctomycetia bacterium]